MQECQAGKKQVEEQWSDKECVQKLGREHVHGCIMIQTVETKIGTRETNKGHQVRFQTLL